MLADLIYFLLQIRQFVISALKAATVFATSTTKCSIRDVDISQLLMHADDALKTYKTCKSDEREWFVVDAAKTASC